MSPETRAKIATHAEVPAYAVHHSAREPSRALGFFPAQRTYGLEVPADSRTRLAAFAAFVRRATDQAKLRRNWSVEDIADAAGISANTIYLWRSGKGTNYPQGDKVEAFCDALGIKPEVAFSVLWPGSSAHAEEPIPLSTEQDLIVLARKLADPNVPEREKFLIRETIQSLAARSTAPVDSPQSTPKHRDVV
jgi:transcriptional regulator with XRE-family HTH domain